MYKLLIFLLPFLVTANLFAVEEVEPTYVYKASGGVTDIVMVDNRLYAATDGSAVDIFDTKTHKLIKTIQLPKIEDFMGDEVDAKVSSVDFYHNRLTFVVQTSSGVKELYLYENGQLKKLISEDDSLYITKARFIDDNHILFSLLGNTMYLYNFKSGKTVWTLEVKAPDAEFSSTFSDFALNEDKSLVAVVDESGDVKIVDVKAGKVTKVLSGKNLDKVFKVDFKQNRIITAGRDGRVVVYDLTKGSSYTLREKKWFFVYSVGLSPSGKLGAFSLNQKNDIAVFDIKTHQKLYLLKKNIMNPTVILFVDDKSVFVATDANKLNFYKLQ